MSPRSARDFDVFTLASASSISEIGNRRCLDFCGRIEVTDLTKIKYIALFGSVKPPGKRQTSITDAGPPRRIRVAEVKMNRIQRRIAKRRCKWGHTSPPETSAGLERESGEWLQGTGRPQGAAARVRSNRKSSLQSSPAALASANINPDDLYLLHTTSSTTVVGHAIQLFNQVLRKSSASSLILQVNSAQSLTGTRNPKVVSAPYSPHAPHETFAGVPHIIPKARTQANTAMLSDTVSNDSECTPRFITREFPRIAIPICVLSGRLARGWRRSKVCASAPVLQETNIPGSGITIIQLVEPARIFDVRMQPLAVLLQLAAFVLLQSHG
ncbi:hypothetical protein C8R44DRAFT_910830 [Mycena epipterygia]|nr:hypothetical protein C8R44DRAFT_910830 [Mycena epipterygia]